MHALGVLCVRVRAQCLAVLAGGGTRMSAL